MNLPNNVMEIGDRAFCGCRSLTQVIISDSVTYMGLDPFFGCLNLTEVVVPDSLYIAPGTFRDGIKLTLSSEVAYVSPLK